MMPICVREDIHAPQPIPSLPGLYQFDLASVDQETDQIVSLGIPAVILFGIPTHKDASGSVEEDDGIVQNAIRRIKASS